MLSIYAPTSYRGLDTSLSAWRSAVERISTTRRINSAYDDAAGLAISERFAARIGGMQVARRGVMDGISMAETADGALGQVSKSLQRMRELALQSNNGTYGTSDRASLDAEFQQLGDEIERVVGSTTFNGRKILSTDAGALTFQTGPESSDTITVRTTNLGADADLAAATGSSIAAAGSGSTAVDRIDAALERVNGQRALMGATQARFEAIGDNLDISAEAASATYGRLVDANLWRESSNLANAQIVHYASIAMLAKQNQMRSGFLSLFA